MTGETDMPISPTDQGPRLSLSGRVHPASHPHFVSNDLYMTCSYPEAGLPAASVVHCACRQHRAT